MEQSKKTVPQWLQNLQENSWEIELLISGGAVFTLLQFPDIFLNFIRTAKITSDIPGTNIIMVMGMAGIKILTNGFILHLLLRSFWLAMVCINYIFPQGIDARKMHRAFPFRSRHVAGDLQEQIMKVDRFSGLVIFMTIMSTLVLAGLVVGIMVVVFFIEFLGVYGLMYQEIDEILGISTLIYFCDLLLMGTLRRIPVLSWLLFPFFWVYDVITFRSFYTRPLALFSSNIHRPTFFFGASVFIIFTGVLTYIPLTQAMHWPRIFDAREYREQLTTSNRAFVDWYYADKREPGQRGLVYIPSHLIEYNFLQVNLRYDRWMDDLLAQSNPDRKARFLSNLIELSVDDSLYAQVEWIETKEIGDSQMGLMAMVDISDLSNGFHKVRVKSKNLPFPKYQEIRSMTISEITIPFWKDVH
jgi:hypothetical protein